MLAFRQAVLRFIARELASYALHGVLGPMRGRKAAPRDGAAPTILFIHGHGGGAGAFLPLERALRRRGFGRFASYDYWARGSVDELAAALARHVTENVPGPLHVIGHSLGGLIARVWLQEHGGRGRAVSLTTLSSPHGGVAVPAAGMLPVVRELLPGSPLLARLEVSSAALDGLPCLSVISSNDHFVRPWTRASFARARVERVEHVGHVGVLFSGAVADLVAGHLRAAL